MTYAYRVRDFQILDGPDWIASDRWDIQAKAEEGSISPPTGAPDPNVPDAMSVRTQSLLEDRFQLNIHRETRELPIYELVLANGGNKLVLSEDQTPFRPPERGAPPPPLPQPGKPMPRGSIRMGRGSIDSMAIPLTQFVNILSQQVGRTVIDKTGLPGLYDVKLQWTPDMGATLPSAEVGVPPTDQTGPSIFTAIQEQLGLRLISGKGPVEVIIIDSVQKPMTN